MDINTCINKLGLNANIYKLTQSIPPHTITYWSGNDPKPTQAELETAWSEIESERLANQYKIDRKAEYPALAEQLDEIYHNGIDSWKAVIKVTKDKYPKG